MKLAEALILRADSQKRIEQLKTRLIKNARIQEDDEPAESPETLLQEFETITVNLTRLIQKINQTNSKTDVEPVIKISDAIAIRDTLQLRIGMLRDLASAAVLGTGRITKSEIRFKSTVSVRDIQAQIDDLSRQRRESDSKIQALNWQIEIMD